MRSSQPLIRTTQGADEPFVVVLPHGVVLASARSEEETQALVAQAEQALPQSELAYSLTAPLTES